MHSLYILKCLYKYVYKSVFTEAWLAHKSEAFSTKCEILIETLKLSKMQQNWEKMQVFTCSEAVLVLYIVLFLVSVKRFKKT